MRRAGRHEPASVQIVSARIKCFMIRSFICLFRTMHEIYKVSSATIVAHDVDRKKTAAFASAMVTRSRADCERDARNASSSWGQFWGARSEHQGWLGFCACAVRHSKPLGEPMELGPPILKLAINVKRRRALSNPSNNS